MILPTERKKDCKKTIKVEPAIDAVKRDPPCFVKFGTIKSKIRGFNFSFHDKSSTQLTNLSKHDKLLNKLPLSDSNVDSLRVSNG